MSVALYFSEITKVHLRTIYNICSFIRPKTNSQILFHLSLKLQTVLVAFVFCQQNPKKEKVFLFKKVLQVFSFSLCIFYFLDLVTAVAIMIINHHIREKIHLSMRNIVSPVNLSFYAEKPYFRIKYSLSTTSNRQICWEIFLPAFGFLLMHSFPIWKYLVCYFPLSWFSSVFTQTISLKNRDKTRQGDSVAVWCLQRWQHEYQRC